MSLLSYTSDEMYSSTELIRKSKNIFDKLNSKDIEKAVILRDGKPSFMLLDFEEYEKLVKDYLKLKEKNSNNVSREINLEKKVKIEKAILKNKNEEISNEIAQDDLEKALKDIENLDFKFDQSDIKDKQPLIKDFWE